MALNIPVNLMNTAASANHSNIGLIGTQNVSAIKPTTAGYNAQGASSKDSNGADKGSSEQQAHAFRLRTSNAVEKPLLNAEAKSIIVAQAQHPKRTDGEDPNPATIPSTAVGTSRPSELDRYAPPDPLPTAPILLAASAYASRRNTD